MNEIVLMFHVVFGTGCILAALWVFVDVLHASEANAARVRGVSRAAAISMWLSFIVGGWWYVVSYPADKAIILGGPWRFAHSYFMETKEHLVILLLLMATWLPIAASNNLAANKAARRLVLWSCAGIVLLALLAEGHGAMIAAGVKMGLIARGH
jgi:hypothetical protein